MAKYRIFKCAGYEYVHGVQRKIFGLWWDVWHYSSLHGCKAWVELKINQPKDIVVKEY